MLGTQCDNHVGPPVRMFREAPVLYITSLCLSEEPGTKGKAARPVKHQHPTPSENVSRGPHFDIRSVGASLRSRGDRDARAAAGQIPAPDPHTERPPSENGFCFVVVVVVVLFSRSEKRERDGESPCRGTRMMGWEDEGDQ
jgi:hypothetical protein